MPVSIPELNTDRFEPYENFRFKVLIDGKPVMACHKLSALRRFTQVVEQRDGSQPGVVRKAPGTTSFEPITLEAGVTHDHASNKPFRRLSQRRPHRALRRSGKLFRANTVFRCWPSEYQALSDLDSTGSTAAITLLTLQNEGWDATLRSPNRPSSSVRV